MVVKRVVNYEGYIFVGLLMVILTSLKLIFGFNIDSDWFWFVAGVALVFEGVLIWLNKDSLIRSIKLF